MAAVVAAHMAGTTGEMGAMATGRGAIAREAAAAADTAVMAADTPGATAVAPAEAAAAAMRAAAAATRGDDLAASAAAENAAHIDAAPRQTPARIVAVAAMMITAAAVVADGCGDSW